MNHEVDRQNEFSRGDNWMEAGGAQAILATALSSKAMSELIDGLATNGQLICYRRGP
jgi:hypothetical protein